MRYSTSSPSTLTYLIILITLTATIGGCPPHIKNMDDTDAGAGTRLEVSSIPAEEVITLENDLTVVSDSTLTIDGTIQVEGDLGQRVVLQAEGDITISGSITAGRGPIVDLAAKRLNWQTADGVTVTPGDGGDVVIESLNGNIVINEDATIIAGDGANGMLEIDGISGGGGSRGGDIHLIAPNGSVTLPQAAGALRLGNGGNGANIVIDTNVTDPSPLAENAANTGARSGIPRIETNEIVGVNTITRVLESETFDLLGTRLGGPGDEIQLFDLRLEPNPFSGGIGGNAGDITAEPLPGTTTKGRLRAQVNEQGDIELIGRDGGPGTLKGGSGGSVRAIALDGQNPGDRGGSAVAEGGNGGLCGFFATLSLVVSGGFLGCEGGEGGNALAVGGAGAPGNSGQDGGDGGFASAEPGGSPFNLDTFGEICGDGEALGGPGGNGGDACENALTGGKGGDGGGAEVIDGTRLFQLLQCNTKRQTLEATGGKGANGGDDDANGTPGAAGSGGRASANVENEKNVGTVTLIDGNPGVGGGVCVPRDGGGGGEIGGGEGGENGEVGEDDNGDNSVDTGSGQFETLADQSVGFLLGKDNTNVASNCNVFDSGIFINSIEIEIPANAKKIRVTVTGSNSLSRTTVLLQMDADPNSNYSTCGDEVSSNTTTVEFDVTTTGKAFVAIADTAFLSDSYQIKVEFSE